MAFTAGNQVRVADQSSMYRKRKGVIQSIVGTQINVRLNTQGCTQSAPFLAAQLKLDSTTLGVNYGQCTG